nr:hypothetical protein [Tanacetum cinerariifolium]
MSSPKFVETHNLVALLKKPIKSEVFKQIIDFLNDNPIKYALTVNHIVYTSCIEQFWATAKKKNVNREAQIQALVDKKKVIIIEASIRRDLRFKDEEGVDCLSNEVIVEQLTLIGHNVIFVICSHTKKVFANMKKEGNDFFGKVTPLFATMMVQAPEDMGEEEEIKVPSSSSEIPNEEGVPTTSNDPLPSEITLVDDTHGRMNEEDMFGVNDLDGDEVVVDVSASKNVEQSVKVVEKEVSNVDPVTTAGEVVTTADIEVTTVATTPQVSKDELTLAQTLIEIKAAKPKAITTAATTVTATGIRPKAKGIVMQEPSERSTPKPIDSSQKPLQAKDKGKGIMVNPERPLKRKDQIMMDEEVAKNLEAQIFEETQVLFNNTMKWIAAFVPMDTELVKGSDKALEDSEKAEEGSSKIVGSNVGNKMHKAFPLSVIEFGDSYKVPINTDPNDTSKRKDDEQSGRTVTITTEDMQRKKNDVKARTTLLLSLPDEHQLRIWRLFLPQRTAVEMKMITFLVFPLLALPFPLIDKDDIEEIDIKWSMALLSMRADKFWKRIGKKISIQGSYVAGFDKSKVKCFNCHKMGHFARECRAPRSQERGRKESYRQGSKAKEKTPKALMAINGVGLDWSYMANEKKDHALVADAEASTEFTLMAKTESKVFDNSLCSNDCKKKNDSLNSKIKDLTGELSKANKYIYHYKLAVAQLEGRLVEYKEREVKYIEKIRTLEMYRASNLKCIKTLDKELEELKLEKDGLDGKLVGLLKASKNLDNLIESQRPDKVKEGVGYNVVPPPAADLYLSPKKDFSWTSLPESVNDTVTDYSRPSPTVASTSAEGQTKDSSTSEDVASPNTPKPFVKFVKPKDSQSESLEFVLNKKACYNCGDFSHLANDCRIRVQRETTSTKVHTADMGRKGKAGSSQNNIDDKGYWDSGCSRHMKGNISHLSDFEPFDGGYVSFGQGGCKI